MAKEKFYDVHFHCMDLSHPNLTAFIDRIVEGAVVDGEDVRNIIDRLKWAKWLPIPPVVLSCFSDRIIRKAKKIIREKDLLKGAKKARSLLSFMENSIEFDFLIMEYFLKNERPDHNHDFTPPLVNENGFSVGDEKYSKIIICPLVIDFGYKNLTQTGVYYNIPPQKPITRQVTDLFNAIYTYYNNSVTIQTSEGTKENGGKPFTKFVVEKTGFNPEKKLFEIYPFFGINPDNYDYNRVKTMLDKYFTDFRKEDTPADRYSKLFASIGGFEGDIEKQTNCRNIFAGIKVYPPLGYDPWPDDCPECKNGEKINGPCDCNKAKVKLIYRTCVERNIPMITHCSNGGFKADPNYLNLTDPRKKWAEVLKNYPDLKIDFAHFGSDDNDWTNAIIGHILRPGCNVYTDFSCNTEGDKYYRTLNELILKSANSELLAERILFGTDFMINMLWIESYNSYLKCFAGTEFIAKYKTGFCRENAERFLFGGTI
jgi:hypothetical protein